MISLIIVLGGWLPRRARNPTADALITVYSFRTKYASIADCSFGIEYAQEPSTPQSQDQYLENPVVRMAIEQSDFPMRRATSPPRLSGVYAVSGRVVATSTALRESIKWNGTRSPAAARRC